MKILNQIALILGIWCVGEYISSFIQNIVVVPGSIIAMILLFLLLQFKVVKIENIKEVSDFFLNNMAIFFVPAGVSLITSLNIIMNNIFVLLISVVLSTVIVMYVTGIVVQKMIIRKNKFKEN